MRALALILSLAASAAGALADLGDPGDPLGLNMRAQPGSAFVPPPDDWVDLDGPGGEQRGRFMTTTPTDQYRVQTGIGHVATPVPAAGALALLLTGSALAARRRR
ncbi:MAG: hypothetical protein DYG94_14725 [Leptolyngbya sp. PLA3]|nr:MAG: hypothetical protein EDM82_15080 [Cyanobacteria bacterium CYA]MCE7969984.1 hypothetical protein [Leptolyngbya sp. PL-A3]